MSINIGINGFGRIGRIILRELLAHKDNEGIRVTAINDITDAHTLAHLFKYDSIHRTFPGEISSSEGKFTVNGRDVKIFAEKDPSKINWKDAGVDVVLECSGIFTSKEKASAHHKGGAKKIIISAPSSDPDVTIAYGVNHGDYKAQEHHILSCASCTTNALAPVARVILDNFGIVRGTMTTIHSFTNDQRILDLPHKDLRRARAATMSMIPTSTGAAKAIGLVIPALKGKMDGFAMRVPTPDVSVVDLVVELERDASAEDLNRAFRNASEGALKNILQFSQEPLVSVDFTGNRHSSIVDALSTMVIQKRLAKVIAWYDNEVGFSSRMIDVTKMVAASL
ncbi:MAG: type I glyceraldehyde-3-phosphate dehydrogenase [Deltaproteobacteria bacterium]|nr:type I glyceraldehyde-3-phosphate dehydrogenase [Deltaproteobacteria bacterium]